MPWRCVKRASTPSCSRASGIRWARNSSRAAANEAGRMRKAMTLVWQVAIGLAALAIWQWGWELHAIVPWLVPDLLDPYFVSKPSEIYKQFLRLGCLVSSDG